MCEVFKPKIPKDYTFGDGIKYDDDKLRYDLLPFGAIDEIVRVLNYGAKKYTANSWQNVENGIERYTAALLRHISAWRQGEANDKESGLSHLSHILCNAMFLVYLDKKGD